MAGNLQTRGFDPVHFSPLILLIVWTCSKAPLPGVPTVCKGAKSQEPEEQISSQPLYSASAWCVSFFLLSLYPHPFPSAPSKPFWCQPVLRDTVSDPRL